MGDDLAEESKTVDQVLDRVGSVDKAERAALDLANDRVSDEDLDRIGMSVRECMVNAVVHGKSYNAHKKVRLSLLSRRPSGSRFGSPTKEKASTLVDLPDPVAGDNLMRHSGRGIFLNAGFYG